MTTSTNARLQTKTGDTVMFEGVKVDGAINGLLLDVFVEQRFRNQSAHNVEVVYTFPLPYGAILLGVDVLLGERRLAGAVVEKRQAARDYEDALASGDAAIMLEKNDDHSYSLNLGNLAAGEACVVTIRYAETLQFAQRGLRICIPTVIAPRYGDPVRDARLAPHQFADHDIAAHHPFTLTLRLPGALAQARIGSPTHPINMRMDADGATVELSRGSALDRDFVLVLDQLTHDSLAITAPDSVMPGHQAALASFCPQLGAGAPAPINTKILVDCSGSMAGDSIDAARRALQAIIGQFRPDDRFSLSRFGSTVQHRARALWKASDRTRLAASRWIGELAADLGGTEMEAALQSTFAMDASAPSDVLLITDGQIHAIDSVIEAASLSGHRLFIVAIGSSPAESHLRRLAQATGGACDFVAAGEGVEPAVLRMFARLRSPRLHGIRLAWTGDCTPAWTSPLPDAIFDGDTVDIYALLRGTAGAGEVVLSGCHGDEPEREIARATLRQISDPGQTLARMAATSRTGMAGADAAEALKTAVAYQLITDRTNFLLVHERAESDKADDMPALHTVAPMLPAGWAGAGSVTASAAKIPSITAPSERKRLARDESMAVRERASPDYDIPAFLRKEAAAPAGRHETEGHSGLTPLSLNALLRSTAPQSWPGTYAELRNAGLEAAVVDWLELAIGKHCGETSAVATFLYVMSRAHMHAPLWKSCSETWRYRLAAARLIERLRRRAPRPAAAAVSMELAAQMEAFLASMSASEWPACVFALDECQPTEKLAEA